MGNSATVSAVLAVALLTVGACGGPSAPAPTSSSTSAAPVELSREQYQAALTELEDVVRPLGERVVAANTLAELNIARAALGNALMKQNMKFRDLTPPADLRGQHRRFDSYFLGLSAMTQPLTISDRLTECGTRVDEGVFVRNSKVSTIVELRRDNMRGFPAELTKAGLKFAGLPLPPEPPDLPNRRAANGEVVHRAGAKGGGTLAVTNNGKQDVAVSAVVGEPTDPRATIYVRAGASATLTGLPSGTYGVYYKTGVDWDAGRRGFTRDCGFAKFLQGFQGNRGWQITLTPAGDGNSPITKIPAF
ncbi:MULTISPECIES: hypothetical protein [unclassified Crossiella]|uniref:hypothetical protein n=1 Tax=unclassified Crossiella TaxID=2620835 RepID=UPI0020001318|nr:MULTISPECIES: hypothetical protein [unclassified Crossiella]MCK2241600.1 hypothetical protein [Crossiella sp. S99.2]MCK2255528.1 hypothetical protein [Crossiella sp. S99.1]